MPTISISWKYTQTIVANPISPLIRSLLTAAVVFTIGELIASPAQVFDTAHPLSSNSPPKAEPLKTGDSNVSTQTGAFQYSYPITVPPGRGGAVPGLVLNYSSQGQLYGTFAAGWTLQLPEIRFDPKQSMLAVKDGVEKLRYVSSLSGNRKLVKVSETSGSDVKQTYRAEVDNAYIRYEELKTAGQWRARTIDGSIYYFGQAKYIGIAGNKSNKPMMHGVARLTSTEDIHGNMVEYYWEPIKENGLLVDFFLKKIEYSRHKEANLEPMAVVEFESTADRCNTPVAIGSRLDLKSGDFQMPAYKRITAIQTSVFDGPNRTKRRVHRIVFKYDNEALACDAPHAPIRLLKSIQEIAVAPVTHASTSLPPVTFEYGSLSRKLVDRSDLTGLAPIRSINYQRVTISEGNRRLGPLNVSPSLDSMSIDMNGDGLLDQVHKEPGLCHATVDINTGSGYLTDVFKIDLPTIPWRHGSSTPDTGLGEGCSLTGQYSLFVNTPPGLPQCEHGGSYLNYRFVDIHGDGLPDLVVSAKHDGKWFNPDITEDMPYTAPACESNPACYDVDWSCAIRAATCTEGVAGMMCPPRSSMYACLLDANPVACDVIMYLQKVGAEHPRPRPIPPGTLQRPNEPPTEPNPDPGPKPACVKTDHEKCDQYVWAIYENVKGRIDTSMPPKVILSPIPLESNSADAQFGATTGGFFGSGHALYDMDGDGFLDAVTVDDRTVDPFKRNALFVWRGDGTGKFNGATEEFPYLWPTIPGASLSWSTSYKGVDCQKIQPNTVLASINSGVFGTLTDMNSDGLPDLVWPDPDEKIDGAFTYFNLSNEFHFKGDASKPSVPNWLIAPPAHPHAGNTCAEVREREPVTDVATDVTTRSTVRLVDFDGDGRQDLYESVIDPSEIHTVHFGRGYGVFSRVDSDDNKIILRSDFPDKIKESVSTGDGLPWYVLKDFIDITGDGLADIVDVRSEQVKVITDDYGDFPLRLMKQINNGRGLVYQIGYAQHNDQSIVDNSHGDNVPNNFFVVKYLKRTNGLCADPANPSANECDFVETKYRYSDMVFNNSDGHYQFRGFTASYFFLPNGSRSENVYGYDVDPTGLLKATYTFDQKGTEDISDDVPLRISETDYKKLTLFSGATKSYVSDTTRSWFCSEISQDTFNECRAREFTWSQSKYSSISSHLEPLGQPVAFAETETSQNKAGQSAVKGDKKTVSKYLLFSDENNHVLRKENTLAMEFNGAEFETTGDQKSTWSDEGHFLLTEGAKAFEGDDYRRTIYTYVTNGTGQVHTITKPKQSSSNGSGKKQTNEYDDEYMFVSEQTNELLHVTESTTDYGTGEVLSTRGPNADSNGKLAETMKQIDGFGRTRKIFTTTQSEDGQYKLIWTGETVYKNLQIPANTITRQRIEFEGSKWTVNESHVDGLGRVLRKDTHTDEPGVLATEQFIYDRAGRLVEYVAPHPQKDDETVSYSYSYDVLDRPTQINFPAENATTDGGAISITYDRFTTLKEELPGDNSPATRVETSTDSFGRLIKVRENLDGDNWATTAYEYDGNDNLARITDADGLLTELGHDWLSNRQSINRAGREWKYSYDLNRNMERITVPHSDGEEELFTTIIAYDDIDRPVSRTPGLRDLTPAERELFSIGETVYEYDNCPNGIGLLCRVVQPGILGTISYAYDPRGNTTSEHHHLFVPGNGPEIKRTTASVYNALNNAEKVWYADADALDASTLIDIDYDSRGLPVAVAMLSDQGDVPLATLQRNRSGRIVLRTQMPDLDVTKSPASKWSYDPMGRVTSQVVTVPVNNSPEPVVAQGLTYFKMGDVEMLKHSLGSENFAFDYQYDSQHQLRSVLGNQNNYQIELDYLPSGILKSSRFSEGAEMPRDVSYEYEGSPDPHAVSALKNIDGSGDFATFGYDKAGNLLQRNVLQGNETGDHKFKYDGEDWQRNASGPQGEEIYYYDHSGNRILAVQKSSNGIGKVKYWIGASEIHFVPNASNGFDVDKSISRVSLGQPVARVEKGTSGQTIQIRNLYHSTLQHLLASIDEQNHVAAGFIYGPFGEILHSAGVSQDQHERRFNGKDFDSLSGLSYYGARYYDRISLSWTQSDPLYRFAPDIAWDEPRRADLYSFAMQNPMRYVDPDGQRPDMITSSWGRELERGQAKFSKQASPYISPFMLAVAKGATPDEVDYAILSTGAAIDGPGIVGDAAGAFTVIVRRAGKIVKELKFAAKTVKKSATELKRPYIRKSVRETVESRAKKTPDGKFVDPNSGRVIEDEYHLGHKPGHEFRREKSKAEAEGLIQEEFNERMNNPDYYQIEHPKDNLSHKYEKKDKQ